MHGAHFKLTLFFFLYHVIMYGTPMLVLVQQKADKAQKSGKMTTTIYQNVAAHQKKRDISMANGDSIMQ